MVASPSATPVTLPLASTAAISGLSDFHDTFLFAASFGDTVAASVSLAPTRMEIELLSSVTPVTLTAGGVGSGASSLLLLHDQRPVVNNTAATSSAACLSILFFI